MAGQISNFRLFLHKISDELGSDELESLKFLCLGNLTKARLEKIKNSKELFVAIGEVTEDEEKQLDLLKQLFRSISRRDLEARVKNFQQTRQGEINQHEPFVAYQHVEDNLPPRVNQAGQHTQQNIAGFQQATGSLPSSAKYGESSLASHMSYLHVVPQDISLRQAHSVVNSPYTYADSTSNSEGQYKPRTTEINQHTPFVTSQHVEDNLPPQVNQTGQPTLRNIAGFHQATDSLPNTVKYGENSLASHMAYLPQDKPLREASSGVSSPYAYADSTPYPGKQYEPHTTEQDYASRYQSQYSVPFGEQEQSSEKDQSAPNSFSMASSLFEEQHVHEKIEQPHLTNHLQSSPNSFGVENTHHNEVLADDKIKPQDLSQSSSNSMSKLPMETSQGTSRDSGQNKVQHEALGNTGSTHRGRSWTDGATTDTSSDQQKRISQPSTEKIPIERVMSNDYHVEVAQHDNKCPVEMNYNSISKYFNSGGKNLGKGGFGIVYEGIHKFHGQSVVVKEEYTSHLGQAFSAAQLRREKRVGYIKHPHLMPLYAFCEEKGKPRCLMYPKMHSDLHKALRSDLKGQQRLPWEIRVRIALHTARALLYLHTEVTNERNVRQEIVHMDVKPGNIFLDEDLNARLGDPGMAQELPMEYSYASISQPRGTDGYMDEYLQDRHLKPVNDVFSFGVVLLQLLTQRRAMEKKPQGVDRNKTVPLCHVLRKEGVLSDPEKLMEKAPQGVWPMSGDDKKNTQEFAAIAIECLKQPDERAKLSDVCQRLEEILERKGVSKASKPKEGDRCVSCLLNFPAKYLEVKSHGCDSDITQNCNYFCVTCLSQARRNPLECPSHGPAEPPIGGSDVYAVLVCGNDPFLPKSAAIFERDLLGFKSVLTDNRIVGLRNDHVFSIMPSSSCGMSQAQQVRQVLQELRQRLQGKKDVFLYFYFSGHSDQNGNLLCWCSSEDDVLTTAELSKDLELNVNEFMIILDCCYADGKIASEHVKDDNFLVHKSPTPVESMQHPLESLYNNLQKTVSHEDSVEPVSVVSEEFPQTGFDTLDGNVFTKAPLVRFTIRQWSSSLSHEESYAKGKGSFFTHFMVCGLRGAPKCQFSNCSSCKRFKAKAKSLGYISAANLEDFVSNHVEIAAREAGGRHQTPRMRTVHSKETILAFYNEEILCDEIVFRSTSGISERISIDDFPLLLQEFQQLVYFKVQGHLPSCAQPKHIQILCDDQEIDATSYVDLQEFIRQGYDVRCQLRPCSSIINGPVVIEIQNYKNDVITLLTSLQLTRNQQDVDTFEIDTSKRTCSAEDIREYLEEEPTLGDLRDTSVVSSISEILTEASVYQGHLVVCVFDDSLECTFTKTLD